MILPYLIDFTDKTDPAKPSFQIQPGQINTSTTSLSLPGQGRVDYGELYNENLVRMLEHFSSPTAPATPTKGQLWYDSSAKALKVYDNATGWTQLKTVDVDRFHVPAVAALPTTNLQSGDIVFLTTDQKLYICVAVGGSTQWVTTATQQWCETEMVVDCGTVAFV